MVTEACRWLMDPQILRSYVDHFLPRDVVGPVLVVFALEGVIDGLFSLYVPEAYATVGWGIVFLGAVSLVAYWGATDEVALEELQERVEEIEESESTSE